MCVKNLLKVVTRQCFGSESNLRLWVTSGLQVRHVTVRLASHTPKQKYTTDDDVGLKLNEVQTACNTKLYKSTT